VYLVRDVRDVVVSYYRMYRWLGYFRGTLSEFVADSVTGRVDGFGPWSVHVASWARARRVPATDIWIVTYEDLLADAPAELSKILTFLEIESTPEGLEAVVAHNTVDRMRKAETDTLEVRRSAGAAEGRFVRQASRGGWREELSAKDLDRLQPALAVLASVGYTPE